MCLLWRIILCSSKSSFIMNKTFIDCHIFFFGCNQKTETSHVNVAKSAISHIILDKDMCHYCWSASFALSGKVICTKMLLQKMVHSTANFYSNSPWFLHYILEIDSLSEAGSPSWRSSLEPICWIVIKKKNSCFILESRKSWF